MNRATRTRCANVAIRHLRAAAASIEANGRHKRDGMYELYVSIELLRDAAKRGASR